MTFVTPLSIAGFPVGSMPAVVTVGTADTFMGAAVL
jgi:hypothetical protein